MMRPGRLPPAANWGTGGHGRRSPVLPAHRVPNATAVSRARPRQDTFLVTTKTSVGGDEILRPDWRVGGIADRMPVGDSVSCRPVSVLPEASCDSYGEKTTSVGVQELSCPFDRGLRRYLGLSHR